MSPIDDAMERTRRTVRALQGLTSPEWTTSRTFSVVEASHRTSSPSVVLDALPLSDLRTASICARCDFGGVTLEVTVDSDRGASASVSGPIDARAAFDRENRNDAAAAWDGDPAAALRLPGEWEVTVAADLSSELNAVDPQFTWHVLASVDDLSRVLDRVPAWELAATLDVPRAPVFVVEHLGPDDVLLMGRAAVLPMAWTANTAAAIAHVAAARREDRRIPELPGAASPEVVRPVERQGARLADVEDKLWRAAATLAWIGLATALRPTTSSIQIEILGLQRVAHEVGAPGIDVTVDQARASYELFVWAGASDAVDQRLAVQQVASLYRDEPPWAKARDVADAAHAVFASLRRDAVGEALQARRAARSLALGAAQSAAEQTAHATRATFERIATTLLALGGVIVAQTTAAITVEQAQGFRTLIVGFLVALALWNWFVEGPPLRDPIDNLRADLPRLADILTEGERSGVLALSAVTSAGRRARILRLIAPLAYLLVALVAWFAWR